MRKFLFLPAVLLASVTLSFSQAGTPHLDIISKLKTFLAQQNPEKAYLQFDKPYYEAGDTIYFKAYLMEGDRHQPSDLSGVLHVDLINTENKIAQSIKLQNEGGVCHGDFALADSLHTGIYRVRAYTQWMRNSGEKDFFEKPIRVSALHTTGAQVTTAKPSRPMQKKNDLQFFPEGGSLVSGINTKVAFKAIDTNGLAVNAKGVILDNTNKEVGSFSSAHLGMGYFLLNPLQNSTYKARVTFEDGTQNTIDLPQPSASGISLMVNNDSVSKAFISVKANAAWYKLNRNKDFLLLIYSGGKVISAPFTLDDPEITLTINKEQLYTGVATVTLFSGDGKPLCERLLFVQNNDQLLLTIKADKTLYNKREKVSLLLNVSGKTSPDSTGNLSVSVINESGAPQDESDDRNILTDLLLTSDLKGYVEQPNYYFRDTIKDARSSLDVLMLTQGYRSFEWKEVLDSNKVPVTYLPEKALEINGMVASLDGTPLPGEKVNLVPSAGGPVLTGTSDKKGWFHFSNLIFTDTVNFVLNTSSTKKSPTKLTYSPASGEPVVSPYKADAVQMAAAGSLYVDSTGYHNKPSEDTLSKAALLKEVKVRDIKQAAQYRTQNLAGAGNADQVLRADAIQEVQGELTTRLNGRLSGISFSGGVPYLQAPVIRSESSPVVNSPMLVIVDGTEANPGGGLFNVDQIDANQVETVEVLKYTGTSIYGVEGANGVLVITTNQQKESSGSIAAVGVLPIAPVGFYGARTFYSPKYNYHTSTTQPDYQFTLYWNPEVKPGKDGNASFSYYNNAGEGTYKVTVEGMDSDGNLGRLVYKYKVK